MSYKNPNHNEIKEPINMNNKKILKEYIFKIIDTQEKKYGFYGDKRDLLNLITLLRVENQTIRPDVPYGLKADFSIS